MKMIALYLIAALPFVLYFGALLIGERANWWRILGVRSLFGQAGAAMSPGSFPTMEDFRAHMAVDPNSIEVIRQSLYDTMLYPTAGQVALLFFQTPIGQGLSASPGNANNPKALTDTNMQSQGQLPAPQGFWISSAELDVQPGSSATANTFALQIPKNNVAAQAATVQAGAHDVNAIYSTGSFVLTIGQKPYLQEAPLLRFPPKCRFEYDCAIGFDSDAAAVLVAEKMKAGGRPYVLDPGLALMTSQTFNVTLGWPVVVATPSGFNAAVRCTLDGWLFRAVQ